MDTPTKPLQNQPVAAPKADDFLDQFLATTFTKTQAIKRLRILRDFLNFVLYQQQKQIADIPTLLEKYIHHQSMNMYASQISFDVSFLKEVDINHFKSLTPEQTDIKFRKYEEVVNSMQVAMLYLPFELPNSDIAELGDWFKKNIGLKFLYEFQYDPGLVGGCAISYKGKYQDYSVKNLIAKRRESITNLLLGFKNNNG